MTNEKTYHSSEFPKPQENMSTKMNKLIFRNYSLEFTGSSFTWVNFQNYILWLLIISWLWNNSCYKIHVSEMCYSVPYCICISKINTTILFIFLSYTHTHKKKNPHIFSLSHLLVTGTYFLSQRICYPGHFMQTKSCKVHVSGTDLSPCHAFSTFRGAIRS